MLESFDICKCVDRPQLCATIPPTSMLCLVIVCDGDTTLLYCSDTTNLQHICSALLQWLSKLLNICAVVTYMPCIMFQTKASDAASCDSITSASVVTHLYIVKCYNIQGDVQPCSTSGCAGRTHGLCGMLKMPFIWQAVNAHVVQAPADLAELGLVPINHKAASGELLFATHSCISGFTCPVSTTLRHVN